MGPVASGYCSRMRDIMFTSGELGSTAHKTLESAIEASVELIPRERAVVFWRYTETGREVLAVRAREGGVHRVSLPFDPFDWWESIDVEAQRAIVENHHRGLTVDQVARINAAPGGHAIGAVEKHGEVGKPFDEDSARYVISAHLLDVADALTEPADDDD